MITFRSYTDTDYAQVKALLEEAGLFDATWHTEINMSDMVKSDPDAILIAHADEIIAGCIFIIPFGNKVCWLFSLAVKKSLREQGVGSQLIEQAETIFKKRGVAEIGLYVDANNPELQEFYQKRKFSSSGKPWLYFWKKI